MSTLTPGNLPASPNIPLSDELRAAYQDLYDKLENEYQSNADATAREAIEPVKTNVSNVLTKDNMCRFDADTALFQAQLAQINDTNNGLKTLQGQIAATASHFKTAGEILGAINTVLSLVS